MRIKSGFFLGLVSFFLIILPFRFCQASDPAIVTSVIDGETLQLAGGEKVRLIGIDVPASSKNAKLRDDIKSTGKDGPALIEAGKNAAKFLRKLIKNEKIVLEYDEQEKEKEKSARRWVYAYFYLNPHLDMEMPKDWFVELSPGTEERQLRVFLNATLIKSGYAQMKIIPPNVKFQEIFSKLQEEAKEQKRGFWGGSVADPDREKKSVQKTEKKIAKKTTKKTAKKSTSDGNKKK